jgi:uncharacterized protein YndB with AHSA1/START domain
MQAYIEDSVKAEAQGAARMSNSSVIIERTYSARLDELWSLWTTQRGFESWWGPQGFESKVHSIEPRSGGILHYELCARTPEQIAELQRLGRPTSHEEWTRFTELKPRERVSLTTVIDFLPGVKPYEHTITADFSRSDDGIHMTVTLEPMHNEEFTELTTVGFNSQLSKLDERFAGT